MEVNCPLCGSQECSLFDLRVFRGEQVTNRLCRRCGFVYQSPRMPQEKLDQFYASEYRQLYQGDSAPVKKDLAIQKARADHLLGFMRSNGVNQLDRCLDIGSSAGLLLNAFSQGFHCTPVGVEPGEAYREVARHSGLKVYSRLEDMNHQEEGCFNLVSLVHVLEHLPDPVATLRQLRKDWLDEHGYLLVEVPNLYCHDCFEVAHLASYSFHSLIQVLNKAGFHEITSRLHGNPRSKLLPLYITVLAAPNQEDPNHEIFGVNPEKSVKLKRQWGLLKRHVIERLLPGMAWQQI